MEYLKRPQLAEDIYGIREESAELTKKQAEIICSVKKLQLKEDIGSSADNLTELLDV